MKRIILYLGLACMLLASCAKEGAKLFEGDYSYQTSGKLKVVADQTEFEIPVAMQGQMDILRIDPKSDEVLIVKRDLSVSASVVGGINVKADVSKLSAKAIGDSIFIDPYTEEMTVVLNDTTRGSASMRIVGKGVMYDDHILIEESYRAVILDDDVQIGILTSVEDVLTAAERN